MPTLAEIKAKVEALEHDAEELKVLKHDCFYAKKFRKLVIPNYIREMDLN